jgi:2-succinyl-6-hydroxy-2,4-cyclohexadiene-1-carboxylate synthase
MGPRLHRRVIGRGPRLALVHGFTQDTRCWGRFASSLADDFELALIDAPGHGGSASVTADVASGAALIGDAAGRAAYLGYSMGGRHVLRLALDRPGLVTQLVLIGASPGIDDPTERRARVAADDRLAARLESIGVDAFIDEWLSQPLFAGLPAEARFDDERKRNTVSGLAASLRLAGTGAQESLWPRLPDLRCACLLVVGAEDHKFGDAAREMRRAMGTGAELVEIAGAGHAPHLERPDATAEVVREWLLGGPAP